MGGRGVLMRPSSRVHPDLCAESSRPHLAGGVGLTGVCFIKGTNATHGGSAHVTASPPKGPASQHRGLGA